MKTYELKGSLRTDFGKKAAKAIRSTENVPCVLYGAGENIHFTVSANDVRKLIYTPDVHAVALDIEGKKATAVIKELQFHPVKDNLLHIDFLAVSKDKPVTVEIPVKLTGLAAGVKAGGKLSLEMRKLKINGIYTEIPELVVIDVTDLAIGKKIQVADLKYDKLQLMNVPSAVVAQVKATRAAATATEASADASAAQ